MMAIKSKKYCSGSIILLLSFLLLTNTAYSAPILRIEVGQHTAMINRMAVDKEAKLLATAADDKTLRLWNLPEGTLYTTLRVPIDEHLKGELYAVAVSPDGKTVITSGETSDDQQKFSLYVFDVEKGDTSAYRQFAQCHLSFGLFPRRQTFCRRICRRLWRACVG
jgi:WD40 repeat protein